MTIGTALLSTKPIDEVLDENYLPTTSKQYELFQEKQKYLYGSLESKVETAKGKAIIHKHESNYDAKRHMLNCRSIILSPAKHP
jgi:hypothetical protein